MFNERFTFDNSNLESYISNTDSPEDEELESRSERLARYATEVRRFSVLLNQVSTWEIYQTAIYNSDPHIALVLASAKDYSGNPQYPTRESITNVLYETNDASLLQDGVRRVSIAFTASVLIGQLSQVPEQFSHFESVRDQAIADLDRIVNLPDLQDNGGNNNQGELEQEGVAFYWGPNIISFDQGDSLTVDIYTSGGSDVANWQTVETYSNDTTLATIVADLADFINQLALVDNSINLIASPVLSGEGDTHALKLAPRRREEKVNSEVLSIRFLYVDDSENETLEELPFRWGVDLRYLSNYYLNSGIVTVNTDGSTQTSDVANRDVDQSVLYFRSDSNQAVEDYELQYRISPTDNEIRSVFLESSTPKEERPSRLAFKLINEVNNIQARSGVLGAIIRNDSLSVSNPTSAVSFVSHSVTDPERNIVLDILKVPKDILLSIGDLNEPLTTFSSKPKSLVIDSRFRQSGSSVTSVASDSQSFSVYKLPRSKMLDNFRDEDLI